MPRKRRSYLPGIAFHITSRTNGKEPWFNEEVRCEIVGIVGDSLRRTDARLAAFTIMSNHLHLVVHQGRAPLARLMQPVCRRIALAVQRVHGRVGHIFGNRFHDTPCVDVDHLRQVIYYTHRNPVRANMCAQASDYAWSSHHAYAGTRPVCQADYQLPEIMLNPILEIFACTAAATPDDLYAGYMRFCRWREQCDALPEGVPRPPGPVFPWGDVWWGRRFRPSPPEPRGYVPDLRDLVLQALRELAPQLTLELLCVRRGSKKVSAVRREIIARAVSAGYPGTTIAHFLDVSDCTVSRVADQVFRQAVAAESNPPDTRAA